MFNSDDLIAFSCCNTFLDAGTNAKSLKIGEPENQQELGSLAVNFQTVYRYEK